MDFAKITKVFERAEKEGRDFLLEAEVYALLREAGVTPPAHFFLPRAEKVRPAMLRAIPGETVVLKIVSPLVVHKTDVGGVRFVRKTAAAVEAARRDMMAKLPARYAAWAKQRRGLLRAATQSEVADSLRGILVVERVEFEDVGFGSEILLGLRNSREFGPVVSLSSGGLDVEHMAERLRPRAGLALASALLLGEAAIPAILEPLAFYGKIAREFRGRKPLVAGSELARLVASFQKLGAKFSALESSGGFVIEEAEVNPFVIRRRKLVPLDGLCRFSRRTVEPGERPAANIKALLRPESLAVIGVSEKMNLGHIILNNVLRAGFPRERTYVVKPGTAHIEGCRCVDRVADLPETVDLFVLTLSADQSLPVIKDLVDHEKAKSVIIIAGGLGEKSGTQGLEEEIRRIIRIARSEGRPAPVINGGNCLGVYSRPGRYDTTFIPEHKLAWPRARRADVALISQSGAFMISRLSKTPAIEPLYGISLGNQIDLTASDYLDYLKDDPEVRVFGLYIEGFQPGDGLALARAAREAVARHKKSVVVYKSGRTPEGREATSGHTASVAGDYRVARALLEEAGVYVAETILEFEAALQGLSFLGAKSVRGNRVGLISNAGFECVIMSDSLQNEERLELAAFSGTTKNRLTQILARLGIDKLQDIRNPLDVTPVADDAVFCDCAGAILEDECVDGAVVSPVPMTPAMQTLPTGPGHTEDLAKGGGLVGRLAALFRDTDKPFVVNVDAGRLYDPLADALEKEGLPVFRRSDEAVGFLRKFMNLRLKVNRSS